MNPLCIVLNSSNDQKWIILLSFVASIWWAVRCGCLIMLFSSFLFFHLCNLSPVHALAPWTRCWLCQFALQFYHGEAVALILRLHAIEVVKVNKPVILLSCSCWSKSSHELNVFIIQTENKLKIYYNDKLFPEVKQLIYVHCLFFCSVGILGW